MRSQPRVNFASMPVGKTDMASVAGDFSYHIRMVPQAVLAAMLQVAKPHLRSRLNVALTLCSPLVFKARQAAWRNSPENRCHQA